MLENKFFLTSVAKFLRRDRVDRGTGGGKVVVVGDLSKRKVRERAEAEPPAEPELAAWVLST
jgi:hypothetical protein